MFSNMPKPCFNEAGAFAPEGGVARVGDGGWNRRRFNEAGAFAPEGGLARFRAPSGPGRFNEAGAFAPEGVHNPLGWRVVPDSASMRPEHLLRKGATQRRPGPRARAASMRPEHLLRKGALEGPEQGALFDALQ